MTYPSDLSYMDNQVLYMPFSYGTLDRTYWSIPISRYRWLICPLLRWNTGLLPPLGAEEHLIGLPSLSGVCAE